MHLHVISYLTHLVVKTNIYTLRKLPILLIAIFEVLTCSLKYRFDHGNELQYERSKFSNLEEDAV